MAWRGAAATSSGLNQNGSPVHVHCPPVHVHCAGCLICGETKSLAILGEMKHFYEERMRVLDANSSGDCDQNRLTTLKQWVADLEEQNSLLVRVVEELEQEACNRVTLLDDRLRESSKVAQNFMLATSEKLNNQIQESTADKMKLEKRLENLQSDAKNLCSLIRQGRQTCNWSTDGMCFHELTKGDIFGDCADQIGQQDTMQLKLLAHKDAQIRDLVKKIQMLEDEIQAGSSASPQHDKVVHLLKADLRTAEATGMSDHKANVELTCQLKTLQLRSDFVFHKKKQLEDELGSVHRELHFKSQEVIALNQAIADIEKSSKDMQAALTAEVADKHDQISLLRRETQQLEERCHQADMQITFKDGVIKEMRKTIKCNRSKIADLEDGIINKCTATDDTVRGQSPDFRQEESSKMPYKEQEAIVEKQSKPRPKVSKFFQPNTGDYIVSSGQPYGDSIKTKPLFSSLPESSVKFPDGKRVSSPPTIEFTARDAKVGAVVGDNTYTSMSMSDKHVNRNKSQDMQCHHCSLHLPTGYDLKK